MSYFFLKVMIFQLYFCKIFPPVFFFCSADYSELIKVWIHKLDQINSCIDLEHSAAEYLHKCLPSFEFFQAVLIKVNGLQQRRKKGTDNRPSCSHWLSVNFQRLILVKERTYPLLRCVSSCDAMFFLFFGLF